MLPYPIDEASFDEQIPTSTFSGHWKASLNPIEGQEGFTPYLHQQQFDKADVVLDMNNDNVDTELIFNNIQEAYDWRSRSRTVNPQSAADPTIPRNREQKKAAVKLVFKAYKSVALATDNPGMLKAFQDQKHDNRQVETICWSIVEGCIDRCDRGPLLNAYEPDKAKNNPSIKTFAERLDAIVESLSHQKTICKHLLDAPYLNRFLDDPVGSKQRVESNRKLNKKKGGVMNVGKKALAMEGKKGKPSDMRKSNTASDDETEEYGSESQEHLGDSSGISSPFRTPDHPVRTLNGYSDAPRFGTGPLYPLTRSHNVTPTPSGRRQRAATTGTPSLLQSQTSQPAASQHHGTSAEITPNHGMGYPMLPMSMLPVTMVDAALPNYTSGYPYCMGQNSDSVNPYQNLNVSPLPNLHPRPELTSLNRQHTLPV